MVRFKSRYIVVQVNPYDEGVLGTMKIDSYELRKAVQNSVQKLHGDFGVASIAAGFSAKYCNPVTRISVIRGRHGPHRILATSLPFVTHIGKKRMTLRTLYTGATLKHCYLFIQKYQKEALIKMWKSLKNDEERKLMEKAVMDLSALDDFETKKPQITKD